MSHAAISSSLAWSKRRRPREGWGNSSCPIPENFYANWIKTPRKNHGNLWDLTSWAGPPTLLMVGHETAVQKEILSHCDVHVSKFGNEIVAWDICWEWEISCIYIVHIHFFEEILATRCWRLNRGYCTPMHRSFRPWRCPGSRATWFHAVIRKSPSSLSHAHLFSIDTENHHAQWLNHLKMDFFP